MKTKREIVWRRSGSVIKDPVRIPAGAPVQIDGDGTYWIDPAYFRAQKMHIEAHDAAYYGCRVECSNVER